MLENADFRGVQNLFNEELLKLWNRGRGTSMEEPGGVVVQPPMLASPLTQAQENALQREIQEMRTTDFGIPQYIRTPTFVRHMIF